MKKLFTLLFLLFSFAGMAQTTIFSENMGTPTSNTLVNSFTGWQNTAPIVISSTSASQPDVRTSTPSSGYTGASGDGNIWFTTNIAERNFLISGINTTGFSNITLSFGMLKTVTADPGFTVEYSTDGTNFTNVDYTGPTSANTWTGITATTLIPEAANLTLRFTKVSTAGVRLDDVTLLGTAGSVPSLLASPSSFSGISTTIGNASASQSFDLNGTNLTPAAGSVNITGSASVEVSTDNVNWTGATVLNYTGGTISAVPVYVRIAATAAPGAFNGNVTISGGGATDAVINIDGNITQPAPSVQATNIIASNITDNSFDVNWTNGNGAERILVVRPTSSGQVLPTDGTLYTAPGSLGANNDIWYAGSGTGPISITGLTLGTSYTVHAYEYNGGDGTASYNTTTATNNPIVVSTTGISNTLQQGYFTAESAPLFMASGSSNRMPTMYIATVTGLTPNTTYRYYTQAGSSTDFGNTVTGAGSSILIDYTVTPATFSISSNGSLNTAGAYGKFTTDATGKFTGTFGFTQTGNARFNAGSQVYPTIALGEEITPSTPTQYRFALDEAITPLAFSTSAGPTNGSFLQGSSLATAGNLVAIWQSTDGSSLAAARPLSMTLAETITPVSGTWTTSFISGYSTTAGSWNTVIPNDLPNGVRLIQQINLMGEVIGCESDADGIWPDGGNTINPTGGTTPIIITDTDAPIDGGVNCEAVLPVSLSNFAVQKLGNTAKLIWSTEQEFNSHAFIIERSFNQTTWVPIGTVAAAGISQTLRQYSFIDNSPVRGTNFYRLRMVDQDLKSQLSETKSLQFNITKSVLISPNPANNYVNVYISETGKSEIVISNMSGKIVDRLQTQDQHIQINTSKYAAGIYIVKIMNGGETTTQKLVVQ